MKEKINRKLGYKIKEANVIDVFVCHAEII